MISRSCITAFLVLASIPCLSQKTIERTWNAEAYQGVEISSNTAYSISVRSGETKNIQLTVTIEGETYEQVLITASESTPKNKQQKPQLHIRTGFTPFFEAKNDKLAAHKVLAIEMRLVVPETYNVRIESASASVTASGNFKRISVSLERGRCTLTEFYGDALLQTKAGDIEASVLPGVQAKATTTYGELSNTLPATGDATIVAESLWGNISLSQTK
jgi:hypothetical protein